MRIRIYLEPRDAWLGVYVAPKSIYVCPLPFLVIRYARHERANMAQDKQTVKYDLDITVSVTPLNTYGDPTGTGMLTLHKTVQARSLSEVIAKLESID